MGNNRQYIPLMVDPDALFELFRDRIAAEVARQVSAQAAAHGCKVSGHKHRHPNPPVRKFAYLSGWKADVPEG